MLFRTNQLTLVNICRTDFNTDKEYYAYIKKIVAGNNEPDDLSDMPIVDTLVALVNKHGVRRIANKNK